MDDAEQTIVQTEQAELQDKQTAKAGKAQDPRLYDLLGRLDNLEIEDYVRLALDTRKILWLNFVSGIMRGLGFTVGTAIVLAVVYKVLSGLISMNIPYLTEMLTELVLMIKGIK